MSSNPFDKEGGLPSVAFATKDETTGGFINHPIGYKIKLQVTQAPKLVQSRKFGSGDLLFWNPNKKGDKITEPNDQPVMSVVTHGTVVADTNGKDIGVEKALWAQKPSALFGAIGNAINDAKVDGIKVGDLVEVHFTGYKQGEDQTRAAAKQYAVTVTPANAFSGDVPVPPAPVPAPPAVATPPPPPPAPAAVKATPEGYTLASLIAGGWTKEQAILTYPVLADSTPAGPPAPAADVPVQTVEQKQADALSKLSPEDKALLGL